MKIWKRIVITVTGLCFLHCGTSGTAGTRVGNPENVSTSNAFPTDLAITSPLLTTDSSANLTKMLTTDNTQLFALDYEDFSSQIDAILEGDEISDCSFDITLFFNNSEDAECYGPQVSYQNHPDGTPSSGTLPTGDLGIWSENEGSTNESCASAQLNSRIAGVSDKAFGAMQVLASTICVANNNSVTLSADTTSDLTSEMNSMTTENSIDVTFSNADIYPTTNSDGNTMYIYNVELTYTDGSDTTEFTLNMKQVAGSSDGEYSGIINFKFNDDNFSGMNCSGFGATEVTKSGSLFYDVTSSNVNFEYRTANFCGADQNPFASDMSLDFTNVVSSSFDATSSSNGWGDDGNLFIASFDPETGDGNYSYSWQAGYLDSHSRAFNVNLQTNSSVQTGEAYFGYGYDLDDENLDGSIVGFLCNWAGPGNNHSTFLVEKAQKQVISYDSTNEIFTSDSSQLAITYAPTNSCDATAAFLYDTDADGSLADETGSVVTNDLIDLTEISSGDFTLPSGPTVNTSL